MMIYNNYNVVQNIYEKCAAGERAARFSCVFVGCERRGRKRKKEGKNEIKETKKETRWTSEQKWTITSGQMRSFYLFL